MKREANSISARCKSCRYFWHVNQSVGYMCCEYILRTGTRRPCPPGDACTVYQKKQMHVQPKPMPSFAPYKWTPSRIARAKAYLAEGMTYRQVADKMCSTKEAVRAAIDRDRKKEGNNAADLP